MNRNRPLKEEVVEKHRKALAVIKAVADTIKEVGEAPAGVVYSALMQWGCSLQEFEAIIRILVNAGVVTQTHHVLKWVEPKE